MAVVDDLITAKEKIAAILAASPGPDYSLDGQSVSRSQLLDQLAKLNELIQIEQGPFELLTQGRVTSWR